MLPETPPPNNQVPHQPKSSSSAFAFFLLSLERSLNRTEPSGFELEYDSGNSAKVTRLGVDLPECPLIGELEPKKEGILSIDGEGEGEGVTGAEGDLSEE